MDEIQRIQQDLAAHRPKPSEGCPNIAEKLRAALARAMEMGDIYILEVEILIQLLNVNPSTCQFKQLLNEGSRPLASLK